MKQSSNFKLFKHLYLSKPEGPVQLTHFVTSKCNAKCIHCFYKENLNKGEDLSLDKIKRITENLPSLYFLVISGGEPFLREDLAEIIIAYYNNTGVNEVVIPTNGFLSDKIVMCCKKILTSCPGLEVSLVISLDGPADIHDKIRGVPGGFEKAVKTFFEMKKLKHANPQLKISILSTLMSFNQLVMIDFLKFVKSDLKPDAFSVNFLRAGAKDPDLKDVRIENLKMILDIEEQELGEGGGLKSRIRRYIHKLRIVLLLRTVKEKKYIIPCRAGVLTGVLSENGTLYPCEQLSWSLGNIKKFEYDFRKVWKSGKIKDCRKFILQDRCFCTNECFTRLNIISNPWYIIKSFFKRSNGI